MFKELGQMASMLKQLQGVGGRMQEMKDRLTSRRVTGTAGNGRVQIEMDGTSRTVNCTISDDLLSPTQATELQSLVVDAVNDAQEKVRAIAAEEMKSVMGVDGMPSLMKMLGGMGG